MGDTKKRSELDYIFNLLEQNKTKLQIKKEMSLNSPALANQLRRLENLGLIKREGKYAITILKSDLPSSLMHPRVTINQVHIRGGGVKRGHAHNFKVYFHKKVNLLELPKIIQEQNLFKKLSFGSLKLIKKGFTIWINKYNLTIYSNNSYYSKNAMHSKFAALKSVDSLVQELIFKYNLPKIYGIEVFREHYGLIFNTFANWIISKGGKMYVKDNRGKAILWVDKSRKDDIGLNEFEGKEPLIINNADTFFQSHEKHGFKVDADFTINSINKLTLAQIKGETQLTAYAEQNKEHLALIKEYREESRESRKLTKALLKELKDRNVYK